MKLKVLEDYLHEFLNCSNYKDACFNGLQVDGCSEIKKIAVSVSPSEELFEKCVEDKYDLIILHHALIWKGQSLTIKSSHRRRLKLLLENDIALMAYHLPLDAHSQVGNNFLAAKSLGVKNPNSFADYHGQNIGFMGTIDSIGIDDFLEKIQNLYKNKPTIYRFGPNKIKKIGIVSGGASGSVVDAVKEGIDLFISGEVNEHIYQYAKEEGIHFVKAGHYATERLGIKALGEHIKNKFEGLEVNYLDFPVPI